jgi:sec-independent protein translocase protein TatA
MALFQSMGPMEWLIIGGVVLLLFGPSQLPKLAKTLGKTAKAMREGIDGKMGDEAEDETEPEPEKPVAKKAAAKKTAKKSDEDDA